MTASSEPNRPGVGSTEIAGAARGGAITFVGAAFSAAMGFLLSVLLARLLGAAGAGEVFGVIAAFMIGLSLAKLGMDTTAVWLLPRLRFEDPGRVRPAVLALLGVPVLCSATVALTWLAVGGGISAVSPSVRAGLDTAAWFLPVAVAMTVALAATRAFGGVLAFNAVDNMAVPLLRVVGVAVAVAAGGGTSAVVLGWSLPWLAGLLAASTVLVVRLRDPRWAVVGGPLAGWSVGRTLRRRIARYAGPRTIASGLEQSIIWVDVLLVGVIVGAAAAGVYGVAARFVAAGVLISTAIRIVVAPRFSAMLAQGRGPEVEALYRVTAGWILLLGAPVYLTLAFFAPTVLDLLGPGFASGAAAMTILCLGSIVVLAAGNIQSLLLMSGRSGLGAVNKTIVLVVNVVGNVVLLPRFGLVAAAATWAASMLLDTALAAWQVRRATGRTMSARSIAHVGAVVTVCVAVPMAVVTIAWGQGLAQLGTGVAVAAVLLGGACVWSRDRLQLRQLVTLGRS